MNLSNQLISLYLWVCKHYSNELFAYSQRFSRFEPKEYCTDEELITCYLFAIMQNQYDIKQIYQYTQNYWKCWFPTLPSYQTFNDRLNRFESLFPALLEKALESAPSSILKEIRLMDSMPIVMAGPKRRFSAKVAPELSGLGYCSSKDLKYYGVKVHILALRNKGTLPHPHFIGMTDASKHDFPVFEMLVELLHGGEFYGDSTYFKEETKQQLLKQGVTLHTPVKRKRGEPKLDSRDRLYSKAVSHVRQPIESLFQWIQEKTKIQIASKVRSAKGLQVHVFGKLTAAMLILNPIF